MAVNADLITYLQGLGGTHILPLNDDVSVFDVSGDYGDSVDPTLIKADQYLTEWDMTGDPVCEGVENSVLSYGDDTDYTTKVYSAEIDNRGDFNSTNNSISSGTGLSSTTDWNAANRTMLCWARSKSLLNNVPTAVFGHGGGTNNQLFGFNLGGKIFFQSADAGQPFLIQLSNIDVTYDRAYLLMAVWERYTEHAGSGNRVILYVNGVLQGAFELNGQDAMAGATGQGFIGNAQSNYQSFGSGTLGFLRREKEVSIPSTFNNTSLSEVDAMTLFERTLIPNHTLSGTVQEQQDQLDLLIGSTFSDTNCAIRVLQATDATDYRLFVDDIAFVQNAATLDKSFQFVGSGTLTLENVNGSNAYEVSTPDEIYTLPNTIIGGGSIQILNDDRVRLLSVENLSNVIVDKVIIETPGDYEFTDCLIGEVENVSGGLVSITTNNSIATRTETDGELSLIDGVLKFSGIISWKLFLTQDDADNNTNLVEEGSVIDTYKFPYTGSDVFFLKLTSGVSIIQSVTVLSAGTTIVELSTSGLLAITNSKIDALAPEIELARDHARASNMQTQKVGGS